MPSPTDPDPPVLVAWRDVRKTFGDGHQALAGVSLEVRRGEFLAILGTSGSGKTTLLRLVNRLIDPTSGEVVVLGKPTTANGTRSRSGGRWATSSRRPGSCRT